MRAEVLWAAEDDVAFKSVARSTVGNAVPSGVADKTAAATTTVTAVAAPKKTAIATGKLAGVVFGRARETSLMLLPMKRTDPIDVRAPCVRSRYEVHASAARPRLFIHRRRVSTAKLRRYL